MDISDERLALTHKLHALCVDYWHDIDTNWGHNATQYYTEDGIFIGPEASYEGRDKIRAFYKWREDRGDRTVIHAVHNFKADFDGDDKTRATCNWFMMLYAADGLPVLPSNPPIQICYMTDKMVLDPNDGWLVASRTFENWFTGGIPTTNPKL